MVWGGTFPSGAPATPQQPLCAMLRPMPSIGPTLGVSPRALAYHEISRQGIPYAPAQYFKGHNGGKERRRSARTGEL